MNGGPVALIVVAAGPGSRLGAGRPKALVDLGGRPLLAHTLESIARASSQITLAATVVVAPPTHLEETREVVADGFPDGIVVAGGAERQDSVRAGLEACPDAVIVAVHDAARPFLTGQTLASAVTAAATHGAAIAALPAVDTIKIVDRDKRVVSTPARDRVWLAQTPQTFQREVLIAAHASAADNASTDDASLVEAAGGAVRVVEGDPMTRKITTSEDLRWAEWALASGQWPR